MRTGPANRTLSVAEPTQGIRWLGQQQRWPKRPQIAGRATESDGDANSGSSPGQGLAPHLLESWALAGFTQDQAFYRPARALFRLTLLSQRRYEIGMAPNVQPSKSCSAHT